MSQVHKTIMWEAYSRIDEQAHIHGIALIPRISRNNNLYTKRELKRFNGVKVPLNWEHDPARQIGSVTFHYNEDMEQVSYDGFITDDAAADLARNRVLYTSIEAEPVSAKEICNGPGDCFSMPFGLRPVGLGLTETPGVPETSVIVIESMLTECKTDRDMEKKYVPNQANLNNEQKIEDLLQEDCIDDKISKLDDENPNMSHDQKIAVAVSMCSDREAIRYLTHEFLKFKESFCTKCGEKKSLKM